MLKGTMWRHAQGAMLMSCAEVDNDLKEVIEKLKKLGDNPSKFYREMQVTLDNKVDELLFDDSVEDGLNTDFLENRW